MFTGSLSYPEALGAGYKGCSQSLLLAVTSTLPLGELWDPKAGAQCPEAGPAESCLLTETCVL